MPTLHIHSVVQHFIGCTAYSRLRYKAMHVFILSNPSDKHQTDGAPSSKDGVTNKVLETTRSISVHHRSHLSLGAKLLCKLCPKVPPQGIISSFLVFLSTFGPISYFMSSIISGTASTNYASFQGRHS
jgi:hypothetical protein